MNVRERFDNAVQKYQEKAPELSSADAKIRAISNIDPAWFEENKHLLADQFSRPLFGANLEARLDENES